MYAALLSLLLTLATRAPEAPGRQVMVIFKHSEIACVYERRVDGSYRLVANCAIVASDVAFSKEEHGDGRIPEGIFTGTFDGTDMYVEDPAFGMEKVAIQPQDTLSTFTGEIAVLPLHFEELATYFTYLGLSRFAVYVIPARYSGRTTAELGWEPNALTDAMDSYASLFAEIVRRIRDEGVLPTLDDFDRARDDWGVFGVGMRGLFEELAPDPPSRADMPFSPFAAR